MASWDLGRGHQCTLHPPPPFPNQPPLSASQGDFGHLLLPPGLCVKPKYPSPSCKGLTPPENLEAMILLSRVSDRDKKFILFLPCSGRADDQGGPATNTGSKVPPTRLEYSAAPDLCTA